MCFNVFGKNWIINNVTILILRKQTTTTTIEETVTTTNNNNIISQHKKMSRHELVSFLENHQLNFTKIKIQFSNTNIIKKVILCLRQEFKSLFIGLNESKNCIILFNQNFLNNK